MRGEGEVLFEEYLRESEHVFKYEAPVGTRYPDFTVDAEPSKVVCEVVALQAPIVPERPKGAPALVGASSPYEHIRTAIERKRRQGKGARGIYPYVLVIRPTDEDRRPYGPMSILGAMLGDLAFSIPLDPEKRRGPGMNTTMVLQTGKAKLREDRNTRFSAVAVLRTVNPTRRNLDAEIKRRTPPKEEWKGWPSERLLGLHFEIADEAERVLTASGAYDPGLFIPRVDVVHNPFASVPLPLSFFRGPYDRQWSGEEHFGLAVMGILGAAVVDSESFH